MQSAARVSGNWCTAAQIAESRRLGSLELGYSSGNAPCNTANSASSTSCNGTEGLADEASFAMAGKPQVAAHGLAISGGRVNLTVENCFRGKVWTPEGNRSVTFQ